MPVAVALRLGPAEPRVEDQESALEAQEFAMARARAAAPVWVAAAVLAVAQGSAMASVTCSALAQRALAREASAERAECVLAPHTH